MVTDNVQVALPDGTFLIVNGAHQGHAGFGLASKPNLQAELYDPSKPLHNRFCKASGSRMLTRPLNMSAHSDPEHDHRRAAVPLRSDAAA
jgi:hypothetical protein